MVDLTKVEGLNDAQVSALTELFESEVGGLKGKVEELLGEKKSVSAKALELEQIAEDARKAAELAAEEKLKASNDMEGLKAFYEKQRADDAAALKAEIETSNKNLEQYHRGNYMNQAKSIIHDDFKDLAEAKLDRMLHLERDEQGNFAQVYKNGDEVVASNLDELKTWASTQDSWKRILNGADSSGAGATHSKSGGASLSGKKYSEMSLSEQIAFNSSN